MNCRNIAFLAISIMLPRLATACPSYETPDLKDSLAKAKHVAIFQLVSSALSTQPGATNNSVASIRIVESLSDTTPNFSELRYQSSGCGALRLDIGGYFLVATTQDGRTLALQPNDRSVLDISRYYAERNPTETSNAGIVDVVREYLESGEAPAWFPPTRLVYYTHAGGEPPAPPDDPHP